MDGGTSGELASWKVDRVLANQRLNLTAASQVASNVPKAWFLVLGCNRQDGKGVCRFLCWTVTRLCSDLSRFSGLDLELTLRKRR